MTGITEWDEQEFRELLNKPIVPLCRMVVDMTISDDEFNFNPGIGKYRIEIDPIPGKGEDELCMIILEKQFYINTFALPFTIRRKAVIAPNDDKMLEQIIIKEFPKYDFYDIGFNKARYRAYPECRIQKINLSVMSSLNFMSEKMVAQWLKPVEKAVFHYITRIEDSVYEKSD